MKKIAANKNYRLMKKATESSAAVAEEIYSCLYSCNNAMQWKVSFQEGSNEVNVEKEGVGKFKITVAEVQAAPTAPAEDEWQPW